MPGGTFTDTLGQTKTDRLYGVASLSLTSYQDSLYWFQVSLANVIPRQSVLIPSLSNDIPRQTVPADFKSLQRHTTADCTSWSQVSPTSYHDSLYWFQVSPTIYHDRLYQLISSLSNFIPRQTVPADPKSLQRHTTTVCTDSKSLQRYTSTDCTNWFQVSPTLYHDRLYQLIPSLSNVIPRQTVPTDSKSRQSHTTTVWLFSFRSSTVCTLAISPSHPIRTVSRFMSQQDSSCLFISHVLLVQPFLMSPHTTRMITR